MLGLVAPQFQQHAVVEPDLPGLARRKVDGDRFAPDGRQVVVELPVARQNTACRALGAGKCGQALVGGSGSEYFAARADQARLAVLRRPEGSGAMFFEFKFDSVRPAPAQRGGAYPGHALESGLCRLQVDREEVSGQDVACRLFDLRTRHLVERRRHHQLLQRKHGQALQRHGAGPCQQGAARQQQDVGQKIDQHRAIPEALAAAAFDPAVAPALAV